MTNNIKKIVSTAAVGALMVGMMPLSAFAAVPTTTTISPSFAFMGSSAITLTVNGSGFDPSAMVNFNGFARSTSYVSPNQLTAVIPASDLNSTGTFGVTVTNPGAGGGTSNAQTFTVGNLVPAISSVSPSFVASGGTAFTLTLNGSNFVPGSVAYFNGSARATTYLSSTQLLAGITASDIASPGMFNVAVVNPGPGGGTSNAQVLTVTGINNPIPVLTGVSPLSALAGSGSFMMTVNGNNFNASSRVRFNGIVKTTTLVSSTQLTAFIPASDMAVTGQYVVDVLNTAPGGGTSGYMLFAVAPLSGTVPTLPNTGFGPAETSAPGVVAIALLAVAATALVVRRTLTAK